MWELDLKEGWAPKSWCFLIVVLEKTLESPLNRKGIKPVNPKKNQSWVFIGRTDAKLKLQYFSYLMWRTDSFEKTLMLGKIEGRRRRGQKAEMAGCHQQLSEHEWASFGSWWWTGRPGMLLFVGSQKLRNGWATELNWLNRMYWM